MRSSQSVILIPIIIILPFATAGERAPLILSSPPILTYQQSSILYRQADCKDILFWLWKWFYSLCAIWRECSNLLEALLKKPVTFPSINASPWSDVPISPHPQQDLKLGGKSYYEEEVKVKGNQSEQGPTEPQGHRMHILISQHSARSWGDHGQ